MSIAERIFEQAKDLPEHTQQQILDFAMFLKYKERLTLDAVMDRIITEDMEALRELAK